MTFIEKDRKPGEALDLRAALERGDTRCVEDLVYEFLATQKLDVLPSEALGKAIQTFVEKDESSAIKE